MLDHGWLVDGGAVVPGPSPFQGGCPEIADVTAISRVNAWAVGSGSDCGSSVGPLAEHYR